jgi:uncharacterized protein involved in exopolysaccharide biosynthesis
MTEPGTPASSSDSVSRETIDLWDLGKALLDHRWWLISPAIALGVLGAVYSLLATPIYQSSALLSPVDNSRSAASASASLLQQFAPVAGISAKSQESLVAFATLTSVQLAEDFINRYELMPILYEEEWDPTQRRWKTADSEKTPDLRDAVKKFRTDIVSVSSDLQTGLITLTISWKDANTAKKWAGDFVALANATIRDRDAARAEQNVAYLSSQIPLTTSVQVQASLGRLLDQELQTIMLAKGNREFAFRVIDPPKVPKMRSSPKRAQITILSAFAGGMMGLVALLFRNAYLRRRSNPIGPV